MHDVSLRSGLQTPAWRNAVAAACLAVAVLLAPACVWAGQLQPLHVLQFTLSSDTATPTLERRFHLIVMVRVTQHITSLRNLILPNFSGLEILGDEQRLIARPDGTLYREVITVVSHQTGSIHIDPAYLDAFDTQNGKPMRFLSNALTLQIGGGALMPVRLGGMARTLRRAALLLLTLAFWGVVALVCIVVALRLAVERSRSRGNRVVAAAPAPVAPSPAPLTPAQSVGQALSILRAQPDRLGALRARALLWEALGVDAGATLSDVLRSSRAVDSRLRRALFSLERASFTHDGDLAAAVSAALADLECAYV
ncbi:MAG: hypothetical protein ACYDHD_06455 [Vulcanimicrobiaceae bacterium]